MKIGELTLCVFLTAMLSLEGWQLSEIYSLRADVASLSARLDQHIRDTKTEGAWFWARGAGELPEPKVE